MLIVIAGDLHSSVGAVTAAASLYYLSYGLLQPGWGIVSARIGTFMNESTMLGGSKGVVFAGTLSARTHMKSIAQLGSDERGTGIGFDLTFELSGYAAASSPMTLGSRWVGVSVLPAFSIGSGRAPHFAMVIGPTVFFTAGKPAMRGLLAFRGEAPLARKERHP